MTVRRTGRRRLLQVAGGTVLSVGGVAAAHPGIQAPGTVLGTVTDRDGNTVAGATVALLDGETQVATTDTDTDGTYVLTADPGPYELTVEKNGFAPFSEAVLVEDGEQVTVDVTLDPPAPGSVFGVVTAASGDPVEGAAVTLLADETVVASTETDAAGQYALAAQPGTYTARAVQLGFELESAVVTLVSGEGVTLDFTLPPGPAPLPGFDTPPRDLDADGLHEDVDGDGRFTIFDVQVFFQYLDSDPVQNNPSLFDFSDTGGAVDVLDVQAMFDLLG